MQEKQLLTREQVREKFLREGVSYASWAKKYGVSRTLTVQIINGRGPCRRGQSHKIAVLLGIKDGVIVDD